MSKNELKFIPPVPQKGQEEYYEALKNYEILFVSGNAGSGKSYMALAEGLKRILTNHNPLDKITIIRPYKFSISEDLGALPGTLEEKITPFVEAIRDNLHELLPSKTHQEIEILIRQKFEFLTLSTLRGRSLHKRYIIVEEAQNVSTDDDGILTILTRIGKESRLVLTADPSQCDIYPDKMAFIEAINILSNVDEIGYIEMTDVKCIYRNKIIGKIIEAFNSYRRHNH